MPYCIPFNFAESGRNGAYLRGTVFTAKASPQMSVK